MADNSNCVGSAIPGVQSCQVSSACFRGPIAGMSVHRLVNESESLLFVGVLLRTLTEAQSRGETRTNDALGSGALATWNPHEPASDTLTFVLALTAAATGALLTLWETVSLRQTQSASRGIVFRLSTFFLVLALVEGIALVAGLISETELLSWTGTALFAVSYADRLGLPFEQEQIARGAIVSVSFLSYDLIRGANLFVPYLVAVAIYFSLVLFFLLYLFVRRCLRPSRAVKHSTDDHEAQNAVQTFPST